jgi:integrase
MARRMRGSNRLSAMRVARATKPGRYADGGGLYLQVSQSGTRAWLFRFMRNGAARHMGLGPVRDVSLAEARTKAGECRKLLLSGADPIVQRAAMRLKAKLDSAHTITFKQCAERHIDAHEAGWKNAKHRAQWKSTLATYAYPVFGGLPVAVVDTALVLKAIEPIWLTKPETADRVRGRIQAVLDWACVRGFRSGENPARWRGHLDKLLPARSKVARIKHHAALPYLEIPVFMEELRGCVGVGARALEFAILTATRTSETLNARWSEIDTVAKLWTIPAGRMKAGREHRVPLSASALEILEALPREGDFVFVGAGVNRPLSNMALLTTLRRMGRGELTVHGFRSTFRDWCAERTAYAREVAEMALAHAIGNQTEAAYRRGDLYEKRRRLMSDWAKYCSLVPATANIVALRG